MDKFDMKDVGNVSLVLGMRVARDRENDKLTISRKKYSNSRLDWFVMSDCNPTSTPGYGHYRLQETRVFKLAATTPTMASQLRVTS